MSEAAEHIERLQDSLDRERARAEKSEKSLERTTIELEQMSAAFAQEIAARYRRDKELAAAVAERDAWRKVDDVSTNCGTVDVTRELLKARRLRAAAEGR